MHWWRGGRRPKRLGGACSNPVPSPTTRGREKRNRRTRGGATPRSTVQLSAQSGFARAGASDNGNPRDSAIDSRGTRRSAALAPNLDVAQVENKRLPRKRFRNAMNDTIAFCSGRGPAVRTYDVFTARDDSPPAEDGASLEKGTGGGGSNGGSAPANFAIDTVAAPLGRRDITIDQLAPHSPRALERAQREAPTATIAPRRADHAQTHCQRLMVIVQPRE